MNRHGDEISAQFREVLERANLARFAQRLGYRSGIYPQPSGAILSTA